MTKTCCRRMIPINLVVLGSRMQIEYELSGV